MTERMVMMDFDWVLQNAFAAIYGVGVNYEKLPDGDFLVEVMGEKEKACLTHLRRLANCQRVLLRARTTGTFGQVVKVLRELEAKNPGINN